MEKRYHIYYKEKCLNWNLSEDEFSILWKNYNNLAEIHGKLEKSDLSYEEVIYNKADYSIQGL